MPRIHGVQARGCNPVEKAWKEEATAITPQRRTRTMASAINCGNPVYGLQALHAIRQTHGKAVRVSDTEMKSAKKRLALEGIDAELSGAAAYAGTLKLGLNEKTVVIITGHGLKE